MQLFIATNYTIDKQTIHIQEERIIHQCHTVLRMKEGDQFFLQDTNHTTRYTIDISHINKKEIIGHISHTTTHSQPVTHNPQPAILCIALPNRMDKAELIVQKLSEIGISQIILFVAARSSIRELKEKTLTRLESIALEATEQSFGRSSPKISYSSSFEKFLHQTNTDNSHHILLDHNGTDREETKKHIHKSTGSICAYIGPEGGFTEQEKNQIINLPNFIPNAFGTGQTTNSPHYQHTNSLTLGSTNLRMETAAIITGRLLQNS